MAALLRNTLWTAAAAVTVVAAVNLLGSASQDGANAPEQLVRLENMAFSPASLTVQRGTKVIWHNLDVVPHTVTAAGAFDSGRIAPGKRWSAAVVHTPGRYDYVCAYHPGMKATLVVQP
ncbi:MAG: blue (type 1) copper domain protein [Polaromonas sp.]|nr:blue (type 1) copper domain protein [Polaromonas sp.]